MKKIWLFLVCISFLWAENINLLENSYKMIQLSKQVSEISVGNKELLSLTTLQANNTLTLKIFAKKAGHTAFVVTYSDHSYDTFDVQINQNTQAIQQMITSLAPGVNVLKSGAAPAMLSGEFHEQKAKDKVLAVLSRSGISGENLIDMTTVKQANKMVRTKLYLVEINNKKAKDLGGITGLGIFNDNYNVKANPKATNGATFSGFLLDNAGNFSTTKGNSLVGTLNFLEEKGIATILDDTVLITTEDKNASFHVGGEVYIPVGLTQNEGSLPTIQLQEKKYGLRLTLKTLFSEKKGYMDVNVWIEDSAFDTDTEHNVKLGQYTEVPSFISKSIQTQVVAHSGQVIALGGRLHSEESSKEEKVPLVGDIPLLGEAFKHKISGISSNDLLFFLVPQIIDPNEALNESEFRANLKEESKPLHEDFKHETPQKQVQPSEAIESKSNLNSRPTEEKNVIEKKQNVENLFSIPTNDATLKTYKVSVEKAFVRVSPNSEEERTVWLRNHAFKGVEEDGWIRITQDCKKEVCKEMIESAWIAKALIKERENIN